MTDPAGIGEDCAELAILYASLRDALEKDITVDGGIGVAGKGSVPFNADVMNAIVTLDHEIPMGTAAALETVSEPWHRHSVEACLLQLPRVAGRMHDLNMARAQRDLETAVTCWIRLAKQALRFYSPSWHLPSHWACPYHDQPVTRLRHVGEEHTVEQTREGWQRRPVRDGYIYCPHCGETWQKHQWPLLDRMMQQAG